MKTKIQYIYKDKLISELLTEDFSFPEIGTKFLDYIIDGIDEDYVIFPEGIFIKIFLKEKK